MFAPLLLRLATVALDHRVASVESVVEELGKKSGQDLRIRHELDDEAVFVSLRPRPAAELMALLARATSAEWVRDEGHVWLDRSPALRRRHQRIVQEGYRDLLRVYGGLSPAQRADLLAGKPLLVGGLSPDVRADLESLLFTRGIQVEKDLGGGKQDPIDAVWVTSAIDPSDTLVCAAAKRLPIAATQDQRGGFFLGETSNLGYILSQQKAGEFLEPGLGYPLVEKSSFIPGLEMDYRINVNLSPTCRYRGTLMDVAIDLNARPVAYGDLPAEHLKELRRTLGLYEKMRRQP